MVHFLEGKNLPPLYAPPFIVRVPRTWEGEGKRRKERKKRTHISPHFSPNFFLNFSASKEALPPYQSHRKHALRRIPFFPFFDPLPPPPPPKKWEDLSSSVFSPPPPTGILHFSSCFFFPYRRSQNRVRVEGEKGGLLPLPLRNHVFRPKKNISVSQMEKKEEEAV